MISRRGLLKGGLLAGAGLLLPWKWESWRAVAQPAMPTLDPAALPKYVDPLVIPPVMQAEAWKEEFAQYKIGVRQFLQQVLPSGYSQTPVWGYGRFSDPSSFNFPAFTVETRRNQRVRVRWENQLVDSNNRFLPHLLPVDPTLHWANPPGPIDSRPHFASTPGPYTGPVPIVTHLHGGHTDANSDGYPEAWYLPNANDIPAGFHTHGSLFGSVHPAPAGSAWFEYDNSQRAATLWYHDHALGITRLNVYAGLAGFWIIRDDIEEALNLPGPAPRPGDAPGRRYYEIPIVIQDRSFNWDGSLFYPGSREFFDGFAGPFLPNTDVSPIWNPEFFGNTMVVNGRTWPVLSVEPRKYRFRFLNGCNSRFLVLKLVRNPLANTPATAVLPFHQIGNDGGLLPNQPAELAQLLMAPAERADVIVDFSQFNVGDELFLINEGPDEPFGEEIGPFADPATTGQVMKFQVVPLAGMDMSDLPLSLPSEHELSIGLGPEDYSRVVTLNEEESAVPDFDGPIAALLGAEGAGPSKWSDTITENPKFNDIELWEIKNFTEDSHPIHLHLVMFEVVNRQKLNKQGKPVGGPTESEDWERGTKDTVIANPGQITRVKAKFDKRGLYVWHCHILEHEDNEMMRPYRIGT